MALTDTADHAPYLLASVSWQSDYYPNLYFLTADPHKPDVWEMTALF
jgi:hypothetical protein